jgi:hypothetical protein
MTNSNKAALANPAHKVDRNFKLSLWEIPHLPDFHILYVHRASESLVDKGHKITNEPCNVQHQG